MAKIAVRQDDAVEKLFPAAVVMRVTATSRAGKEHFIEIVDPRGNPRNPMDDGEIADKFLRLAVPALGKDKAEAALDLLWRIERETSLAPLFRLIALA
jgi:2-methylcitrate dehydratase